MKTTTAKKPESNKIVVGAVNNRSVILAGVHKLRSVRFKDRRRVSRQTMKLELKLV